MVLGKDQQSLDEYEKYLALRKSGQLKKLPFPGDDSSSYEWFFKAYLFDRLEKFGEAIEWINKEIEEDEKK